MRVVYNSRAIIPEQMLKHNFDSIFWLDEIERVANTAPESQVSVEYCNYIKQWLKTEHSAVEIYDFCLEITNKSCCNTSDFVKVLFNLTPYYLRPED